MTYMLGKLNRTKRNYTGRQCSGTKQQVNISYYKMKEEKQTNEQKTINFSSLTSWFRYGCSQITSWNRLKCFFLTNTDSFPYKVTGVLPTTHFSICGPLVMSDPLDGKWLLRKSHHFLQTLKSGVRNVTGFPSWMYCRCNS